MKIVLIIITLLVLVGGSLMFYKKTLLPTVSSSEVEGLGKINLGGMINHPKFGNGTIKEIQLTETGDSILKISFESVGNKNLIAEYANLKKI